MRLIDETAYQDKLAKIPMGERFFVKAVETAQHMPTIDPVKHGRWSGPTAEEIEQDPHAGCKEWYSRLYTCSKCGHETLDDGHYCPNCGCDMSGGNNGKE